MPATVGLWVYNSFPVGSRWSSTAHWRNHTCTNCSVQRTPAFAAPPSHSWRPAIPILEQIASSFVEITRFIWDADPSYDLYNEFTKRHFQANYKVHELISARLKIEEQNKQSGAADDLTDKPRPHVHEGGFFKRLFRRRSTPSIR